MECRGSWKFETVKAPRWIGSVPNWCRTAICLQIYHSSILYHTAWQLSDIVRALHADGCSSEEEVVVSIPFYIDNDRIASSTVNLRRFSILSCNQPTAHEDTVCNPCVNSRSCHRVSSMLLVEGGYLQLVSTSSWAEYSTRIRLWPVRFSRLEPRIFFSNFFIFVAPGLALLS